MKGMKICTKKTESRRGAARYALWMLLAVSLSLVSGTSANETPPDRLVRLTGEAGCVTVDRLGGRVVSWKIARGDELLFMPQQTLSPNGDWSHGGIGLCWPWFGKKGAEPSSIHGFARNRMFAVRSREKLAHGESVTLGLSIGAHDVAAFPYAATLELKITVSDKLALELRTTNGGPTAFGLSNGFQPYFAVSRYDAVTLRDVKDAPFAAVNGMDAAFPRRGDRFSLVDAAWGRTICCKAQGNTGVVVWSPGNVEPHNRNLAAGDTERFIGVGPSNRVKEGEIVLVPGTSHTLAFELKLQ